MSVIIYSLILFIEFEQKTTAWIKNYEGGVEL